MESNETNKSYALTGIAARFQRRGCGCGARCGVAARATPADRSSDRDAGAGSAARSALRDGESLVAAVGEGAPPPPHALRLETFCIVT